MNDRGKSATSLFTLALLGLTMTCDASAGTDREERRTIEQVRSCVSEIAKHADYADSSRAIHWVERLNQKNLVEMEIRIETTVYSSDDQAVHRKYRSSCVIASRNDLRPEGIRVRQSKDGRHELRLWTESLRKVVRRALAGSDNRYVFTSEFGEHWSAEAVKSVMRPLKIRAGFDWRFHDLRAKSRL